MPYPEKGIEKQSIHEVKRKQSKRKEKKRIGKKTEKKKEEIEEKREIVQWACTSRSVSLSPLSNPALFRKRNKDSFWAITI